MKTYEVINDKSAVIDGIEYPIRFDGHCYNIYVGSNQTEFNRKWVSLGKTFNVGDCGEFDENGGRVTQPKKLVIEVENLKLILADFPEALAKIDEVIEAQKAEQAKIAKMNKIAKLQAQLDALMAE